MSSATFNVKNKILKAGAGAGKTTTLTKTFLDFADQFKKVHQRFPNTVVTTFTRKATQELKERLQSKSLEENRQDLFSYLNSKNQVHISTIHGVLSLYLSRYGSAMGLTPDFLIHSDSESRVSSRKILRKILLANELGQELLQEYDFKTLEECFKAYYVNRFQFPSLRPISSAELQAMAQKDLKAEIRNIKEICRIADDQCNQEKWNQYLQSWIQFDDSFEVDQWSTFLERLSLFEESLTKPPFRKASSPFSEELNEELESARKALKDFLKNPSNKIEFWDRHERNIEIFLKFAEEFYEEFLNLKIRTGAISMSDLELLALKLMQEYPQTAEHFSLEWDFWMIDEYQDTSPIQVRLLKGLVGEKPVFIVGDPQQSIYLFRGARSQVFQEKIEEIQAQDGEVEVKLINYRSNPEVLEFFNHYFPKLSPQFSKMTPGPGKIADPHNQAAVEILLNGNIDSTESSFESLAAVQRVQELLGQNIPAEQICILGRTHKVLEDISKVAHEYGIAVQLHSGSGFYQRREVLDALAILKFFINPHDNPNLIAILRSPWLNLTDSEILKFCHGNSHSYWIEALKFQHDYPKNHPVLILKSLLLTLEEEGLTASLKSALISLGSFDYSQEIDSTGRREANLWKLLSMLSQEERRPGFNFLDFLDSTLSALSPDEGGEDSDATPIVEPKRVNLMTVHASKGLQFDQVILPGMGQSPRASTIPVLSVRESDGLWTLKLRDPESQAFVASSLAQHNISFLKELEEQEFNRVLYVALTRAKVGVTLIWDADFKNRSWAASCPLVLDEGEHFETGFKYHVRKISPELSRKSKDEFKKIEARTPWLSTRTETRGQNVSVTSLVEGVALKSGATPSNAVQLETGLARAQQGTDAHKIFESLKYHSVQDVIEITDVSLHAALSFISKTNELPLMSIVENGSVEWGFTYRHGDKVIQGQIDLWGVVADELWVVDYKTGSQKYSEIAIRQLEIYAWVILKMKMVKSKKISLAVVYPLDEAVKIRSFASVSELEDVVEEILKQNL